MWRLRLDLWWGCPVPDRDGPGRRHRTVNQAVLRLQFEYGPLVRSVFEDVVNYGRSLGLDVEVHQSGRWFRSGWIVARGPEDDVRQLDRYVDAVKETFA